MFWFCLLRVQELSFRKNEYISCQFLNIVFIRRGIGWQCFYIGVRGVCMYVQLLFSIVGRRSEEDLVFVFFSNCVGYYYGYRFILVLVRFVFGLGFRFIVFILVGFLDIVYFQVVGLGTFSRFSSCSGCGYFWVRFIAFRGVWVVIGFCFDVFVQGFSFQNRVVRLFVSWSILKWSTQ